jgi:hypothetical protein
MEVNESFILKLIKAANEWLKLNGYQPMTEYEEGVLLKQSIQNLKNIPKSDRHMMCLDGYGRLRCERFPHIKFKCPDSEMEELTDFICHFVYLLLTMLKISIPGRARRLLMKIGNHGICM